MSEKIAISRETLTVLADENCPYGLLMAAKAIARDLLSKPPLISALHENGELIALQATVAQQVQMIEHLRGGPTPLYTAVDMANAARDGFRDGAASKSEPCDACFMAEAEALRKDAALGRVAIKFIDRLCDPAGSDPLEKIIEEYTAAFREAMSKEG